MATFIISGSLKRKQKYTFKRLVKYLKGEKKYAYEKVKPWKFNFLLTDRAAATEKHMSKNKHNCNV